MMQGNQYSYVADGNVNGVATLEISLAFSYKNEHIFTIWPSLPTARYLPYKNENVNSHKNL